MDNLTIEGPQFPTRAENINIIMNEYNTLRTDLIYRNYNMMQLFFVCVTAIVGATAYLSTHADQWVYCLALIFFIICFFPIWVWRCVDIPTVGMTNRLRSIEAYVNELAGERLLIWETYYGYGGVIDRRRAERKLLPPLED